MILFFLDVAVLLPQPEEFFFDVFLTAGVVFFFEVEGVLTVFAGVDFFFCDVHPLDCFLAGVAVDFFLVLPHPLLVLFDVLREELELLQHRS